MGRPSPRRGSAVARAADLLQPDAVEASGRVGPVRVCEIQRAGGEGVCGQGSPVGAGKIGGGLDDDCLASYTRQVEGESTGLEAEAVSAKTGQW